MRIVCKQLSAGLCANNLHVLESWLTQESQSSQSTLLINQCRPNMRNSSSGPDVEKQPLINSNRLEAVSSDVKKEMKETNIGPPLLQTFQLIGVCGCWLAASSGIILVNRHIMKELNFSYPVALSAWGLSVSCFVSWLLCDVFKTVPTVEGVNTHFFWTRIAPVGAAQGECLQLHACSRIASGVPEIPELD